MGDFGVLFRDERNRSKVSAPIKLGEYLASGLPILATKNIGDTESILNEYNTGIILTNENQVEAKLLELIKLIQEPGIKERCRKNADEYFSLELAADKYYSIYHKLKMLS